MFSHVPKDSTPIFLHVASVVYLGSDKNMLDKMYEVNIDGMKNVIDICLEKKCRLVNVSSVEALVATSKLPYAMTKKAANDLLCATDLDYVIVCPSGVLGPNDPSNTHTTQTLLTV
jgi:nucleoside-diphosphate-sugar epimerase